MHLFSKKQPNGQASSSLGQSIGWCCLSGATVTTILIFAIYKAERGLLEVHQTALWKRQ